MLSVCLGRYESGWVRVHGLRDEVWDLEVHWVVVGETVRPNN